MKPLTPTSGAVLDALRDGPATATDLRTRIGCGRSTLDKTLADLARGHLVTRLPDDHPDHPSAWALAPDDETVTGEPDADPHDATSVDGAGTGDETAEVPDLDGEAHDDTRAVTPTDDSAPGTSESTDDADSRADDAADDDASGPGQDDRVKLCRGCQTQMPLVCPTCQSKTTAYCGTCRQTMPSRSRGTGVPGILSNGLPKLSRGQLAELVLDVMRTHPLPDHLGVTGWTSGRIAVYLPGRSTGAIGNVLDKLTAAGLAHQLGDNPKRYQPAAPQSPPPDTEPTTRPDTDPAPPERAHEPA